MKKKMPLPGELWECDERQLRVTRFGNFSYGGLMAYYAYRGIGSNLFILNNNYFFEVTSGLSSEWKLIENT